MHILPKYNAFRPIAAGTLLLYVEKEFIIILKYYFCLFSQPVISLYYLDLIGSPFYISLIFIKNFFSEKGIYIKSYWAVKDEQ